LGFDQDLGDLRYPPPPHAPEYTGKMIPAMGSKRTIRWLEKGGKGVRCPLLLALHAPSCGGREKRQTTHHPQISKVKIGRKSPTKRYPLNTLPEDPGLPRGQRCHQREPKSQYEGYNTAELQREIIRLQKNR
jgi:hypothetical protein